MYVCVFVMSQKVCDWIAQYTHPPSTNHALIYKSDAFHMDVDIDGQQKKH